MFKRELTKLIKENYKLPDNLRGRSLEIKVIPTVCNLEIMLNKLVELGGDFTKLKPWEKRSYKAYLIEDIKGEIIASQRYVWRDLIRNHVLSIKPTYLGASVIDIYLVAYVAENFGVGKERFFQYIYDKGITKKQNSANAIWQVGNRDGAYLGILEENGRVKDWDFMRKWVEG